MKGFAQRSIAPVLVALAVIAVLSLAALVIGGWFVLRTVVPTLAAIANHPSKIMSVMSNGQSINIATFGASGRTDRQLAAFNGLTESFSREYGYSVLGEDKHEQVEESYQVTQDASGRFQVIVHRVVAKDGEKKISNLTLPVWNSEPTAEKRVKLSDGSAAVAYLQKDPR